MGGQQRNTYHDFFTHYGQDFVRPNDGNYRSPYTVEELYQHFKARLMDELMITVPEK